MFEVVCLDDSAKPAEVPENQWIKKGALYTVIKVVKCLGQGGIMAFELEEVKIDAALYKYFAASRFAPLAPTEEEIEENELIEII